MHVLELGNTEIPICFQTTIHRPEIFIMNINSKKFFCTKIFIFENKDLYFFIEFVKTHPLHGNLLTNRMEVTSCASDICKLIEWLEKTVGCTITETWFQGTNSDDKWIKVFEYRTTVKLY